MKRRLLAIFLSLTLMLSLIPSAWAVENEEPSQEPVVEEPTVQTTIPEGESPVKETKEIPADGILTSGSYILNSDVRLAADLTVPVDAVVTLDLNGNTLTGTGKSSVIVVNGKLTVKDSSGDNSGIITGGIGYASDGGNGGGAISIESGGKCTLEGGTLTGNHCNNYNYNAGGVYAKGTAEFYMTGGVITENTANRQGGGIFGGGSSTIVISGGEISNNTAQFGGGVCYNGTMIMTGGKIKNNTAKDSGEVNGASWTNIMGGGIKVNSSRPLEFYGGEVSGNKAISSDRFTAQGAGIYGGNIKVMGDVKVYDNKRDDAAENVYLAGSAMLEVVGDLSSSARLPVTRATQTGRVTSNSSSYSFDGIITADDPALTLETRNGELHFTKRVDSNEAICTMQVEENTLYYDSLSAALADLPSDDNVITLLKDIDLGAQVSVPANSGAATITAAGNEEDTPIEITWKSATASFFNVPSDAELTVSGNIVICGSESTGQRAFDVAGTLNFGKENSESEYPKVEQFDLSTEKGIAAVYVNGGTLNLYSGTLSQNKGYYGGAVSVRYNGNANLFGGTISNNTAPSGGGLYVANSTATLSGTKISENSAQKGGGVYNQNGTVTIEQGEISGNRVDGEIPNGGGIYSDGTVTMNGGKINGNAVKVNVNAYGRGRGAAVCNNGKFTIMAGEVSGNYCEQGEKVTTAKTMYCAGLYNEKQMEIAGGTISNNFYTFSSTLNNHECFAGVGVSNNGGTLTITGGTITGNGIRSEDPSGIGIAGAGVASTANSVYDAVFNMTGGTITGNNGGTGSGAGLYLENSGAHTSTATISGGSIVGNNGASGVYAAKANLSISGNPVISRNQNASGEEKNLYLTSGTTISLVGKMASGANVGVTMASTNDGTVVANGADYTITDEDAGYFVYDGGDKLIQKSETENQLVLANKDSGETYFTVTLTLPEHVTANKALTAQVKNGEAYEVVLTAEEGYAIDTVKVGNVNVESAAGTGKYTLENVTTDTTIIVTEKVLPVKVDPKTAEMNGVYGEYMEEALEVTATYALPHNVKLFAVKSGKLPTGLELSEDGVVSGTPETVTDENGVKVTVEVTAQNGTTAEIELTVKIAKAEGSVTAPTAKELTYTGEALALVDAGSSATGAIQYKLDNGEYSENVPMVTNAGTYTVYYMVVGDANHNDVAEESITVTIAKAKPEVTILAAPDSLRGGGKVTLTVSGVPEGGKVTVTQTDDRGSAAKTLDLTANGEISVRLSNTTAKYTFTVVYAGDNNHNRDEDSCPVSVTRRTSAPSSGSTISVPSTPNGTVTVNPSTASKGETVTITTKPSEGYELGSIEVLDKNGDSLKLKDLGNGKYSFVMPDGKVSVEAEFVKTAATSFADVPANAYFADAVKWAVDKGITNGLSDTMFGPYESCTRAQIVTFLWRAAGSPEPKTASSFTDVSASAYYAKAVAWAVENGITNGMTETTFAPDATCTRGQSVTFLHRALKGTASGSANFTDVKSDTFYADAINWAVANNVTNGTSNTTFSPNADCTRAEIVTFLYRAYQGK